MAAPVPIDLIDLTPILIIRQAIKRKRTKRQRKASLPYILGRHKYGAFHSLVHELAEQVTDPESVYVDLEDRKLSVYVEWQESHLLIMPNYSSQDDVSRLHKHQMSREILALQAENYALEKQLYSYQQSIAKKDSKGRASSFDFGQK